jgi:A/G-specific adenine glycosylase
MMEFPSTEWSEDSLSEDVTVITSEAPLAAMEWLPLVGMVRHTFTHFHLELSILKGRVPAEVPLPDACVWSSIDGFADHALPTVMKKVANYAIRAG